MKINCHSSCQWKCVCIYYILAVNKSCLNWNVLNTEEWGNNQINGGGVRVEPPHLVLCRFSFSGDCSMDFLTQGWVSTIQTMGCLLFFAFIQPLIFMKVKGFCPLSVLVALDQRHLKLVKGEETDEGADWASFKPHFQEEGLKNIFVRHFSFQIEKKKTCIEFFHPCQGVQSVLSLAGALVYLSLGCP